MKVLTAMSLLIVISLANASSSQAGTLDKFSPAKRAEVEKNWRDAHDVHLRAALFQSHKDYPHAIEALGEVIRLSEYSGMLYAYYAERSAVWLEIKHTKEAIADLSMAVSLKPDKGNYQSRARAYEGNKDYSEAIADYTHALALCDNNADRSFVLELRSACYEKAGQKDKALVDSRQAYLYESLSHWMSADASKARIRRLTGSDPPAAKITNNQAQLILTKFREIDATGGDFSVATLSRITGEQFKTSAKGVLQSKNQCWGVTTDNTSVLVGWEPVCCSINVTDVIKIFGPGQSIQATNGGCLSPPPWLKYKRPWGAIVFMLGEEGDGRKDLVLNAKFRKER